MSSTSAIFVPRRLYPHSALTGAPLHLNAVDSLHTSSSPCSTVRIKSEFKMEKVVTLTELVGDYTAFLPFRWAGHFGTRRLWEPSADMLKTPVEPTHAQGLKGF